MNDQSRHPKRKSPRLREYDYSQKGAYFVTLCTHRRANVFGSIDRDGEMSRSSWGEIAYRCWQEIPDHFSRVWLDAFVVMPNHMHGILFLLDDTKVGAIHESPLHVYPHPNGSKRDSLSAIVGLYKSAVSKRINAICRERQRIWQRSFHDHIIRNETSLNKLREYVLYNPARWAEDRYYSD